MNGMTEHMIVYRSDIIVERFEVWAGLCGEKTRTDDVIFDLEL